MISFICVTLKQKQFYFAKEVKEGKEEEREEKRRYLLWLDRSLLCRLSPCKRSLVATHNCGLFLLLLLLLLLLCPAVDAVDAVAAVAAVDAVAAAAVAVAAVAVAAVAVAAVAAAAAVAVAAAAFEFQPDHLITLYLKSKDCNS